ncbi:MAG TPA: alpha/beta fold hydrolase [Longimicrobiales bacterium]|nr:alpha/beta fold hydrolase [Longimicrobiales bacterium]
MISSPRPFERTRTRLDGFRMHALHAGSGDPVVLLHGLSGSHRWWRFTVPALGARHRVHLPEMVGFGGTGRASRQPGIAEMAGLMVRWLDALGVERTDFIGHSMGGQVGIHLAARWPDRVRRLVLVSAAGVPRPLTPLKLAELGSEFLFPGAWGRPSFLPTIAADALRAGPRTLARAMLHILGDDVRPLLPRVTAPTLLLWGARDPLTPVADGRLMEALLPHARLVVLEDAAHNPMADRPELFNRVVLSFLAEPEGVESGAP